MSHQGRAIRHCAEGAAVLLALLAFSTLSFPSCRQPEAVDDTGRFPALRLSFRAGEQFLSDGWRTTSFGVAVDSTRARHTQIVMTTAGQAGGTSDVIIIADSAVTLRTGAVRKDTAYYRLTAEGNLLQYGFLAGLVKKREGRDIPKRWDMVYQAGSSAWTVGSVDLSGSDRVTGSLTATPDYFQVALNTSVTLVAGYRISMAGSTLDYYLWISDAPTCFPRLQEEPEMLAGISSGERRVLTDRISPP